MAWPTSSVQNDIRSLRDELRGAITRMDAQAIRFEALAAQFLSHAAVCDEDKRNRTTIDGLRDARELDRAKEARAARDEVNATRLETRLWAISILTMMLGAVLAAWHFGIK